MTQDDIDGFMGQTMNRITNLLVVSQLERGGIVFKVQKRHVGSSARTGLSCAGG